MTGKDSTRDRALKLLANGLLTYQEAATLAGESRQLVRHWCMRAGIDPGKRRAAYLRRLWLTGC